MGQGRQGNRRQAGVRKLLRRIGALALALVLQATGFGAWAQAWPAKPLKLVAAFPAGGTSDVITRLLAQQLETALGKPVVVENHVGSNGMIGEDYVAKSAPDGYTLLLAPSGHAINNSLNANVPYDPIKDFSFITLVGIVPMVVTAGPRIAGKVNTMHDLIDLAKGSPGTINFGSGGPGSSNQLATELFASTAGIRMTHIPYKGDTPGIEPEIKSKLTGMGVNVVGSSPDDFEKFTKEEIVKWAKVIKDARIQL